MRTRFIFVLSLVMTLCWALACGKTRTVGGLLVEIHQDGLRLDELRVRVARDNGVLITDNSYSVEAADFPATVGLATDTAGTTVRLRVSGFAGGVLRDVRELSVHDIPTNSTKKLLIVLSASCSSLLVESDGVVQSSCKPGTTCEPSSGKCVSSDIDAEDLPSIDDPIDDGGGGAGPASGGGSGQGDPCNKEGERACTGDAKAVRACEEAEWVVAEICLAGEACDAATATCSALDPRCPSGSAGTLFCEGSARFRCGESGKLADRTTEPCEPDIPCIETAEGAECVNPCAEDNGGCAPGVLCTPSVEGARCGACPEGFFSPSGNGSDCLERTSCVPGTFVDNAGTATTDRTCAACAPETFSSSENAESCVAFTRCGDGFVEETPPTSSMDRSCQDTRVRQFGSGQDDSVRGAAVDGSGALYLVGRTVGTLPQATWLGGADAFIAKWSPSGVLLWVQQFGTTADDYASGVAIDRAGDIYVVGSVRGNLTAPVSGVEDAFLRKYSSDGTVLWTQQFGTNQRDWATSVAVNSSGQIAVAGATFGFFTGGFPGGTNQDAFVRIYSSSGSALWTDQVGSTPSGPGPFGTDEGAAVVFDEEDDLYLVGTATANMVMGGAVGSLSSFIRKYESASANSWVSEWTRQFGAGTRTVALGASFDATNERVLIAGSTTGSLVAGAAKGSDDAFLRAYTSSGTVALTAQEGSTASDVGNFALATSTGDLWLVGTTAGTLGSERLGGTDAFTVRFSSQGVRRAAEQFGTVEDDTGRVLAKRAEPSEILVAGETEGVFPGASHEGSPDFDLFFRALAP